MDCGPIQHEIESTIKKTQRFATLERKLTLTRFRSTQISTDLLGPPQGEAIRRQNGYEKEPQGTSKTPFYDQGVHMPPSRFIFFAKKKIQIRFVTASDMYVSGT